MPCQTVVGLAYIDNFDEILEEIDEAARPHVVAQIERAFALFSKETNGIVRKYENDKFLIVMCREELAAIEDGKFEFISRIRGVDTVGGDTVTVSIGIGCGGETVADNMEDCRAAVELALSRGGDQAVVKDGADFRFYGALTREHASRTRVRARMKAGAFDRLITDSDGVTILGHRHMDLDCFGAAIGVYKVVSALDKRCNIILGEMSTNIRRIHERIMKEPAYENVFKTAEDALPLVTQSSIIVIVDTNRKTLIDGDTIIDAARSLGAKIVLIDHHRKAIDSINDAFMSYHETSASSSCELVTEIMEYSRLAIKLRPVEADALLAGITVDTKNFSVKTGERTFESAAYLKRAGADGVRVKLLFQSDLESYRARSAAVASAEIIFDNIAVSVCQSHVENPQIVAAQAADDLLNIDGIEASFVMCYWDGAIIISARSLDKINVQRVMERLGGGGHQTIAGAQMTDHGYDDMNEAEETLKNAIADYIRENSAG